MQRILQIVFLLCLCLLLGCDRPKNVPKPSGKTIRIAVVAPMSGQGMRSGQNALLGIRTALKMQPTLKNGDKVELVIEDNQGTSEGTLLALKKLHDRKDISGVLLMAKSDIVLSVVPFADQYKMPILALIASHPDITKDNHFISQVPVNDLFQGAVAALYVRDEMFIDRLVVFSDPENAHYSFLAQEFISKFRSVGGEVVEHVVVEESGEDDLKTVLEALQQKGAQLLYLAVSPEQVLRIVKMMREINWHARIMGSDGLLSAMLLRHSEEIDLLNGIMATDFYSASQPKTEYGRAAMKIFSKLFTDPGTSYTGLACEGTSILVQAIDRCEEKTDRSCINEMIRHTEKFEGITGKLSIHEDGKAERPIFLNIIDDNKMKFVVKVY